MACRCENQKLAAELERVRRLAKGLAKIEHSVTVVYQREDGTYSFHVAGREQGRIIEYISEY